MSARTSVFIQKKGAVNDEKTNKKRNSRGGAPVGMGFVRS